MSTSPIDKICHVCGDTTATMNYGALTCASCRTFFRRNGFDTTVIRYSFSFFDLIKILI